MPPAEWAHRARSAVLMARDRARPAAATIQMEMAPGWPRPAGAPPLVTDEVVARIRALPGAVDHARAEAERVRAGRFAFFGYPEVTLGPGFDWHDDPITGHAWPRRHWSGVDHRVADADPKWLWELGRHQHIVHLARAWRLTGDDRFAETAAEHIDGFLEQNPPGIGIHWRVGLELGMRLTSWAWIVEFLRDSPVATPERGGALLASADAHLTQLERYPSLYSSANNHRIGELAGLAMGSLCFPEIPDADARADRALSGLAAELGRQVHPDGVDAEQATAYQGFVLDLVTPVVSCLTRLGRPVPENIAGPVAGLAEVLACFASDEGTLPRIGDDDDAVGIDLSSETDRPARLRSRIRTASRLLDRPLSRSYPGLDEATGWLCGDLAGRDDEWLRLAGSAAFPEGGYAVLRRRPDVGELRAILKAGPFGLGPLNAHGHADLLSLYLSVDGEEAIVDPGTFTYYGDPRWREHGRSTAAHPTLRVDGREQAEALGPFIWRNPPRAHLSSVRLEGDVLVAEGHHDAYQPVRHTRRVELRMGGVTVIDRITGPDGAHEIDLRWQLAPGTVRQDDGAWVWSGERAGLRVAVDGLGAPRAITGCESRPSGFVSLSLEHRTPAPTIVAEGRVALPAVITSHLVPVPREAP